MKENITHYISSRQSGKTERLIKMANISLADEVYIIVIDNKNKKFLENRRNINKNIKVLAVNKFNELLTEKEIGITYNKNHSIEIFIDELHYMACTLNINNGIDIEKIKRVMSFFGDKHHTRLVAFSTPYKTYDISYYNLWLNNNLNDDSLENGLMHQKYVVKKNFIPLNLMANIKENMKKILPLRNDEDFQEFSRQINGTYIKQ